MISNRTLRAGVAFALALLTIQASATSSCSAGHYSSSGQTPCTACAAGKYQSQTGSTSCTTAQAGWYAAGPGATSQTQCGQGYYSSAGASSCTICPAGTYCNSNTNTAPTPCEPGRYSATLGAKQDCAQCPMGTFNDIYGATGCCSCCAGWYTDQVGQTHCFNCPNEGSFQQGYSPAGATNKNQCSAKAGAMSSCSQSSSGTCPATGGSSASQVRRRAPPPAPGVCKRDGYKSCPVWNGPSEANYGSFALFQKHECIDVANDIESCGGCVDEPMNGRPSADGGRDCSAIPHVDDVQCLSGNCKIMKCKKGYMLSKDGLKCVIAHTAHKSSKNKRKGKYAKKGKKIPGHKVFSH